jgi:EmrB/QacA subfamily drug resistance transporter
VWILVATILASSMVFIDGTAVNVALPLLQRDLHATIVDTQWIVEAYALFLSALMLVGGSLGDLFGRKRIFLMGVIGFALASAACGAAQNSGQLIAARAVQGVASALLTPGSLAIIGAAFSASERGRAVGIWSSFTAITAAAGPVLGGFIVEHASWRWIFFINIPLAVATVIITTRCVPESREDEQVRRVDWAGALLATLALGSVVYALISASGGTSWSTIEVVTFILGLVLLVVFVVVEKDVRSPMMPLGLFANRNFSAINLMTFLLYGALGGALFFLPFNLIQVQHYSPTAAGAALLPFIGLIFLLSPWAGTLVNSIGAKIPLVIGSLLVVCALVLLTLPSIGGSYWTTFFIPMVTFGFGMSLVVSPLTTTMMASVDPEHFGIASGINNAVSRTASLIAIAAITLAVVASFNQGLSSRLSGISAPASVIAAVNTERPKLAAARAPNLTPAPLRAQINEAIALSYVDGFRRAMLISALLALAAAACATLLKKTDAITPSERVPRLP